MCYGWLLCLFFYFSSAYSADYYVSPQGRDDYSGASITSSWRTIQRAVDSAHAGDTVHVAGGVYNERVHFRNSGSLTNPIRVVSLADQTPIVDGANIRVAGKDDGIFDLSGIEGVEIRGFLFRSAMGAGVSICKGSSYIDISDNSFVGFFGWSPIKVCFNSGAHHINIRRNFIDRDKPGKCPWGDGYNCWAEMISISGARFVRVEENYIYHNSEGEGIDVKDNSSDVVVLNNRVRDTHSHSIYLDARGYLNNIVVVGNSVVNSRMSGIVLANEEWTFGNSVIENVVIKNNFVYQTKNYGIGVGWYTKNALLGNRGRISDVVIDGNLIVGAGNGVVIGCNHSYKKNRGVFGVYSVSMKNNAFVNVGGVSFCYSEKDGLCSPGENGCAVGYSENNFSSECDSGHSDTCMLTFQKVVPDLVEKFFQVKRDYSCLSSEGRSFSKRFEFKTDCAI